MTNILSIVQSFIIGALLVYLTVPVIVRVSHAKKLFDIPNSRKLNKTVVPNLGGIALFFGISVASFLSLNQLSFLDFRYIMTGIIIMFFIGIKDDILTLSANKKFIAQIIAALLIIIAGDIRFTNLHGIFGLHEINYITSLFISLLTIIAIINALNLIDGIDGLATSIGFLASVIFGAMFFQTGHIQYAIVCSAAAGSLFVFFGFNVFGKKNKIFMGDTGSLIIGIILAVLAIQFNEFSIEAVTPYSTFAPTMSLAILSLPLFDMVRVFLFRILRKKSPFIADMTHIHHKLLVINSSHLYCTTYLIGANLFFIGVAILLRNLNINIQIVILTAVVTMASLLPNYIIAYKKNHDKLPDSAPSDIVFKTLKDYVLYPDFGDQKPIEKGRQNKEKVLV
jgi:UDP-GlcNAc:undecaprenyl-phosphate/decaprenyl-phosphate GlcNAc-1-phosphate transferase